VEKLTIRVNIVDRYYPLKIDVKDEEKIRKAAKMINDSVSQYQRVYKDKDSQDFLAMGALQFVTKLLNYSEQAESTDVEDKLNDILARLDEVIHEEQ
jgi:cell division protein ZapA